MGGNSDCSSESCAGCGLGEESACRCQSLEPPRFIVRYRCCIGSFGTRDSLPKKQVKEKQNRAHHPDQMKEISNDSVSQTTKEGSSYDAYTDHDESRRKRRASRGAT